MAIYHFSVKTISRSNGRSAVACAAYRSGEKLVCNFYGKEQDYTKKTGVEFTEIYAPDNTNTELLNRQTLWNQVEKAERRKDALLAREFEIAFPSELNAEQRKNMLNELCQDLVKKYGVIVDAAIHAPHTGNGSDERNYHAHIMFTTRSINEHGDFSAKKYRDFSRDNGTETVSHWRELFAELCNHHLEQNGFDERVDHRSYQDQESDLEATQHEGAQITQLRRQGVFTEISLKNEEIKKRNEIRQVIKGLNQEIIISENVLNHLNDEYSKTDQSIIDKYNYYVEGVSSRLKEREYERLLDEQKKLEDQIDTIKEKEPNALLFWMREKWVKDHNNLIYEYQDNQEKIKKNRNSDPSEYRETAIIGIRKSKPELAEKAEEILLKRASMLHEEQEAIQHARKVRAEKEEKEFKQRQFRSDWSNASARFNKEQIENYNFQIKCILENYHDDFYRKREIESLQRNLISNPNYMKYSKNEFHQKTERLAVKQNQEKRSDNNYDPPSLF